MLGALENSHRLVDRCGRRARIQPLQRGAQPSQQEDLSVVVPFGRGLPRRDVGAPHDLVPEIREPLQHGLFENRFTDACDLQVFPSPADYSRR